MDDNVTAQELLDLCDGIYRKSELIEMERALLKALDFDIFVYTPKHFLFEFHKLATTRISNISILKLSRLKSLADV